MSAKPCMVVGNTRAIDSILDVKRSTSSNYITFVWALFFLCLACGTYLELTYRAVDWPILESSVYLYYLVYGLMVYCFINGTYLLVKYVVALLLTSTVEITDEQQRLCGVSKSDPRFRVISPKSAAVTSATTVAPQYSPSVYTGRPSYCHTSPSQPLSTALSVLSSVPGLSPQSNLTSGLCPQEIIAYNWSPLSMDRSGFSVSRGSSPSFAGQQGSTSYMSSLLDSSCQVEGLNISRGVNVSPMGWMPAASPGSVGGGSPRATPGISPSGSPTSHLIRQDMLTGSGSLRSRHHRQNLSNRSSPLRADGFICNSEDLNNFLQDPNTTKEMRMTNAPPDIGSSPTSGFWSFNRTMMDYAPFLRRFQYQMAPHSAPQSATSVDNPQLDVCNVVEEVWSKLDIDSDHVERWVENLRKWICQTILSRLVNEIADVNKALVNMGSDEVQIGEMSVSSLKQWASAKGQLVPKLANLIPFLDLSANQEYLVQRLRELGSTGCMSAYKWNSGGEFKGKAWEENLPTDAAIVMHALCCYMDLSLPSHPKYPDGKTFTSQHFLPADSKSNLKDRKDHLLMYEVRLHPPQYNIVIEDTVWNVKPGRNNLFQAILLFLYHVKVKEHGMLGRVSLGLSGINILWVLDS